MYLFKNLISMKEEHDLSSFLDSLERKELSNEQQLLLIAGGDNPSITFNGNNFLAGCVTNNCKGGNCGNCVQGCGSK